MMQVFEFIQSIIVIFSVFSALGLIRNILFPIFRLVAISISNPQLIRAQFQFFRSHRLLANLGYSFSRKSFILIIILSTSLILMISALLTRLPQIFWTDLPSASPVTELLASNRFFFANCDFSCLRYFSINFNL